MAAPKDNVDLEKKATGTAADGATNTAQQAAGDSLPLVSAPNTVVPSAVSTPEGTPVAVPAGMVAIDSNVLAGILERMKELEKNSAMFQTMAGKSKLRELNEGLKDFTVKKCHLKVIGGKPVIAWRAGVQDVFRAPSGLWTENMTIIVQYEDGAEQEMRYIDFVHEKGMKYYVMRGKNEDIVTGVTYTLEDEAGKALVVGEKFLNPS